MKVSCIIPTYNELDRIIPVLDVALSHPHIDEIIVVDDGSDQASQKILKNIPQNPKLSIEYHDKNKGKAAALWTGIQASQYEVTLFLDADLINLHDEDITQLIQPILHNQADLVISDREPPIMSYISRGMYSGERCFKRETLAHIFRENEKKGFAIEVLTNNYALKHNLRVRVVRWPHTRALFKIKKVGAIRGTIGELKSKIQINRHFNMARELTLMWRFRRNVEYIRKS